MKKILLLILLATTSLFASAQLKVTSDGKVIISSNHSTSSSKLLVGNYEYTSNSPNIGISGSTTVGEDKSNIGIMGFTYANSSFSNDKNYGVLGIVDPMNYTHGRNYGLSGMIGQLGNHYGGAGLYATCFTYYFFNPTNIQGAYAGYFDGAVKVSGNITATNYFVPTANRLSENVVSLNERGGETSTLDNLLSMNVIQYNMKSRISDKVPTDVENDSTGKVREAYEQLKNEEMKMSARRHFGIDAEELQKIYPDLVLEGQDGYLAVNYVELVPVLIRAIQELKQQVDELQGTDTVKKTPAKTSATDVGSSSIKKNTLYQNTPNPAKEQTIIRYRLADNAKDAAICIFDMQGKMLKKLPISSDNDSVTINGYELGQGMFLYSLVINGQEIETKKMIITK